MNKKKCIIPVCYLTRNDAIMQMDECIKKYNKTKQMKQNLIRNIDWNKNNQTIKISFGKNGLGLTTEFIEIGKFIERMSKTAYVYIENTFIDSLDDVYDITLKYLYKNDESNKN